MKDDQVAIGIIGTGVGLRTHLPAFRSLPGVAVTAVAGSSTERAKAYAIAHGVERALDVETLCALPEIDLVCVTSPNPYHRAQAGQALGSGKHVLCEKPLAMNAEETDELIELACRYPRQLALVNHQLRFNPYIVRVRELLRDGAIGRPYYARVHQQSTGFSDRNAPWSWSFDSRCGGGVRLAMGSHLVDLLQFWFGSEVCTVCAALDPVVKSRKDELGAKTEVLASGFFSASVELESGTSVQLSATAAACGRPSFDFSIFGDEGELHFDLAGKLRGAFLRKRGEIREIPVEGVADSERRNEVSIFSGSFAYFAPRIVDSIRHGDRGGLRLAAVFADAQRTQRVLDALATAANHSQMVRLSGDIERGRYV